MEEFYQNFAYKLALFDPLDREICDDSGNSQTTKVEEILKTIKDMPAIKGTDMDMPLSSGLHSLFER